MSLPKLLPRPTGDQPPEPEPPQASKRRKGAHHTACNPCRDRREKCSGERPECKTCWRLHRLCEYAAPLGVTRQQANKQRLAVVERTSLNLQYLVRLLRESSEADALLALRRIRQAPDLEEAISVLAAAQALLAPASTTGSLPEYTSRPDEASSAGSNVQSAERSRSSSTETSGYMLEKGPAQTRDRYTQNHVSIDLPVLDLPFSRWTSACTDDRFMNHLMTLFWTWDNTVEPMLFRPLFEDDLCSNSAAFCSPFLVNALLALSCLFTSEHAAFSDPGDYMTRGRRFAEEAEQHLERKIGGPSIPLLQGQFAMFVFESNVHGGSESMKYFQGAMETYEALINNGSFERQSVGKTDARGRKEEEGLSWVTWGLYCAAWRVSQTFGFRSPVKRPFVAKLWRHSTFSLRSSDSASYWWSAYPESRHAQESMKVEIREALSNLSELAEKVLEYLYPESDGVPGLPTADPGRAVELYHTLTHWKLLLPSRLRMEDAILPSAILLHSYAEMLMSDILRPFSQFTKMQFGPFEPKERCYSHCVSLMNTIWTFRAFTSLSSEYHYIPVLAAVAFMTLQEHSLQTPWKLSLKHLPSMWGGKNYKRTQSIGFTILRSLDVQGMPITDWINALDCRSFINSAPIANILAWNPLRGRVVVPHYAHGHVHLRGEALNEAMQDLCTGVAKLTPIPPCCCQLPLELLERLWSTSSLSAAADCY
ncbi:hypothetical protein E8E13_010819 [Curvularia kusanoi]|uniref:Zn(2)-C6 fungal-type domain-containing protein n=1 Tax=Curvularia kusanoi TaxID=90978 RepID=A0A9P4TQQ0_CURKU|nr:hypothetical protein E8E13_010819 [Curvularia kusanoi]